PVENSGGLVYFGDPTYWANSESHTSWVRYSEAVLGVPSSGGSGVLWARPQSCPAASLSLTYRSQESGRLTLEVFDAAGRLVERSEHDVGAGQSGTLQPSGANSDGIYFYRLRLSPALRPASEVSGRMVLVR